MKYNGFLTLLEKTFSFFLKGVGLVGHGDYRILKLPE